MIIQQCCLIAFFLEVLESVFTAGLLQQGVTTRRNARAPRCCNRRKNLRTAKTISHKSWEKIRHNCHSCETQHRAGGSWYMQMLTNTASKLEAVFISFVKYPFSASAASALTWGYLVMHVCGDKFIHLTSHGLPFPFFSQKKKHLLLSLSLRQIVVMISLLFYSSQPTLLFQYCPH